MAVAEEDIGLTVMAKVHYWLADIRFWRAIILTWRGEKPVFSQLSGIIRRDASGAISEHNGLERFGYFKIPARGPGPVRPIRLYRFVISSYIIMIIGITSRSALHCVHKVLKLKTGAGHHPTFLKIRIKGAFLKIHGSIPGIA